MALTDVMSGTSSTFTDTAGETVTVTSNINHQHTNEFQSDGGFISNGETANYTFTGGANGDGVQGLAVSIKAEATDNFDFTINGVDVNLQTMIDNGEAQLLSASEGPQFPNSSTANYYNSGQIDANGNLTQLDEGGSISNFDGIISFNVPIQTLSVRSTSDGSLDYIDLYVDSNASVCFTRNTMIDTDQGEVAVQDLEVGMMVRTRDNGMQPVRWVGMSPAKDRAVRIKAGAMGNTRDLVVSPRHRMVLDGWQLDMLFDHDQALVTAMELINDDTIVRDAMADVEYYHVMFDQHEVIYAEGAATESFHPDQASMGSMDAAARAEILALFPDLRDGSERAEIAPTLNLIHTRYVGDNLDAFVN